MLTTLGIIFVNLACAWILAGIPSRKKYTLNPRRSVTAYRFPRESKK